MSKRAPAFWRKNAFWDHSPPARRGLSHSRRRVELEPLEPRLLLSGDGLVPLAAFMSEDSDDWTLRFDEGRGPRGGQVDSVRITPPPCCGSGS